MRFILEAYGESDQLDTFVTQAQNKYRTFYRVTLNMFNDRSSTRFFAFLDAAKEYYDSIKKSAEEDKDYYYNSSLELVEIKTILEEDELASIDFLDEEE